MPRPWKVYPMYHRLLRVPALGLSHRSPTGSRRGHLARVPRPHRRRPLRRQEPPDHLEREGERPLEDGDPRQGLVVAGRARRPGVGDHGRRGAAAEKAPPPKKGGPPRQPRQGGHASSRCAWTARPARSSTTSSSAPRRTRQYCHPFNSYASPTPFIEEGRLYAHFGSHGTWCVDTATGKVLWERRDLKCDHFRGPALVAGRLRRPAVPDLRRVRPAVRRRRSTRRPARRCGRRTARSSTRTDNGDYKKAYATPALFEVERAGAARLPVGRVHDRLRPEDRRRTVADRPRRDERLGPAR